METLDKSKEFFLGHENTVYHVGYPTSFRQEGKVPIIQFSPILMHGFTYNEGIDCKIGTMQNIT